MTLNISGIVPNTMFPERSMGKRQCVSLMKLIVTRLV